MVGHLPACVVFEVTYFVHGNNLGQDTWSWMGCGVLCPVPIHLGEKKPA